MTKRWQVAAWIGLWCFWGVISRNNHPTLLLNGVATALLLVAFAAAVYFNWLILVPRYWRRKQFLAYWVCLLLAMNVLTAVVVVLIQQAYDVLWGPDPRRFGFRVNYGLDFIGMSVHLLAAAAVVRLIPRKRRSGRERIPG